ncbi:hypothetical protein TNCV_545161 [Trichonephila clavipes]|nr:hypothetical protein TNCV_545161 [Trichonephila clavipes]
MILQHVSVPPQIANVATQKLHPVKVVLEPPFYSPDLFSYDFHAFGTLKSGRGSLVFKVTDSWPTCYEFEPSPTEGPPCWGAMHVQSVESSNVLPLV